MARTNFHRIKVFENPRMSADEFGYWENWSGDRCHPLRAVTGQYDFAKVALSLWPFYIVRTPHFTLHHMCRHKLGLTLPELIPIIIYSRHTRENIVSWVPPSCGLNSEFHHFMKRDQLNFRQLAIACGLNWIDCPHITELISRTVHKFLGFIL